MSAAPAVHAQRILHQLRNVETTMTALERRLPADPGVAELSTELGILRRAINAGLEAMVP